MPRRQLAGLAVALVMLFVAAACGQRPGVAEQPAPFAGGLGGGYQINPETGEIIDPETGEIIDPTTGEVIGGTGGTGTTGTTGGGTGSTGTGGTGTDPTGGTGAAGAPAGGSAVGVYSDRVVIGSHAPLTGAAPVPTDSVEKGKDLYFRWMKDKGKSVFGRIPEIILRNDNYTPSQAVAVCKEMVEKDKAFLLSGLAGTDQIQACARYAASVNVPYLSAGVTEVGLTGLSNYFATSMTYPDQAPLLAEYLVNKLGAKGEKNGMLWFNTPNFKDAHDAFISAMNSRGAKVVYDRGVSKQAGPGDAQTVVQEMTSQGIENVFVLTSPTWWIEVLKVANTQNYAPQWVGVGITMTFDTVTNASCTGTQSIDGARFFAPFPAWFDRNRYDQEFEQAVRKFHSEECNQNGCGDDFMWLAWMAGKTSWQFFEHATKTLTRERFVYFTERIRGLKNGIGPTLSFAPDDHFGASEVHVNEARCSDRRWHTIVSFATDF